VGFAGGAAQAEYMSLVRGLDPQRCLVVPVDVGKHSAMALISDRNGELIGGPLEFDLTISGKERLIERVRIDGRRVGGSLNVRVGVEAAGHYHRALATSLHAGGLDVVELNPRAVKLARGQLGLARVKTDLRDCMAMVEMLVRGQGWPLHRVDGACAEQLLWTAQRRRQADSLQALGNQVHALADIAFPGLTGCFRSGLEAKALRMLLATIADPARMSVLDIDALVAHARRHQVRMLRPKASQVLAAASEALWVPARQRRCAQEQLEVEMRRYESLLADLTISDTRLREILPSTPAAVLMSIPGVGVLTASYYGAALGDPGRFASADSAYRFSGLAPTSYESAGRKGRQIRISKEGSVELRQAMLALGSTMAKHHPDFISYRRRLLTSGKRPMVAAVAVAHRAHRLAFAMLRSGHLYDESRWNTGIAKGRPATATREVTATT
jgi:transposase